MFGKQKTILIAESDPHLLSTLSSTLSQEGYAVLPTQDGVHALEHAIMAHPHLLVVDGHLPRLSGSELCTQVREFSTVPIILLTAPGADHERVLGLNLGIDDALTKPIALGELLARVRSVLRRVQMAKALEVSALQAIVTLGELTIDFGQGRVTVAGRQVNLTTIEYRLLVALTRYLGQVVPGRVLLEQVWGEHDDRVPNLLQVTINRLRHKLEPDHSQPRYLQTKPGAGYQLGSPYIRVQEECLPGQRPYSPR